MALLILLTLAGCRPGDADWFAQPAASASTRTKPADVADANAPTLPVSEATPTAKAGAVIARVNGSPLYKNDLYELLVLADGLKTARDLVACKVVDQQAARLHMTVSDADIQAENDLTLQGMFPDVADRAQRERLLAQLLIRGRISRKQWWMSMRRQALLGKMVGRNIKVSDQEIQDAFEDKFGRKVVVRHIQTATLGEAQKVMQRLRAGENFARLARLVSKNASAADGGLLPAMGVRNVSVPKALHQAAWAMTTPGEITGPIQVGTTYHILYLERIIKAQVVDPAKVRPQLEAQVKYRKCRNAKGRLLRKLVNQAKVQWLDPALAGQANRAGNAGPSPGRANGMD